MNIDLLESSGLMAGDTVMNSLKEVDGLDIGNASKEVELNERIRATLAAIAWRALDIATNPRTPQADAADALRLYEYMGIDVFDSDSEHPETETSLERMAKPIIEALEKRYPGSTFELIGDTVVCVDPNGIDLGDPTEYYDKNRSWGTVMENPNDECFKLAVGGQQYDARTGMTTKVYTAMVEEAKASGRELPDSKANQLDNGWYTWTLLTGDPLTAGGIAPCAGVDDDGSVVRFGAFLAGGNRDIRFRPAVKVATDEKR